MNAASAAGVDSFAQLPFLAAHELEQRIEVLAGKIGRMLDEAG